MPYIKNPSSIEETSFKIIQSVIDEEHPQYRFNNEMEESIIKRAIHTTGDFDYLYNMRFTRDVLNRIQEFFKKRGTIIVDSTISLNGINKRILEQMGIRFECFIANEEVAQVAREKGITRAMAAVEFANRISGPKLFAFGGAPTALSYLIELEAANQLEVDAVIGVPVGFINVEESKEELLNTNIPAIATVGRKGGSTIVVAIINAIIYQMKEVIPDDYARYSTPINDRKGEK